MRSGRHHLDSRLPNLQKGALGQLMVFNIFCSFPEVLGAPCGGCPCPTPTPPTSAPAILAAPPQRRNSNSFTRLKYWSVLYNFILKTQICKLLDWMISKDLSGSCSGSGLLSGTAEQSRAWPKSVSCTAP